MADTYGLNDVMEGGVPRRNSNVFDISDGKGLRKVESEANDAAIPTSKRFVPVNAGPVNMDNVVPVDIDQILPKQEKTTVMDNELMNALDMAVDREIESITERHEQLFQAQEKELEEKEAAAEEEAMRADDEFAVNGTSAFVSTSNSDFADDVLYEDNVAPIINKRYSAFIDDPTTAEEAASCAVSAKGVDNNHYNDYPATVEETACVVTAKDADVNVDEQIERSINEAVIAEPDNEETIEDIPADVEPVVPELKPIAIPVLDNIDNDHLFDDDDETEDEVNDAPSSDEVLEDLKKQVRDRLGIGTIKKLDLSKFSVAQKAISAQKVMKLAVQQHQNAADWVLPSANRSITVTGLSGPEILKLNPENSNRNKINTFRDMYRVIYDHIIDGNKPEFEVWLKVTRFADLQHIYFALYMATFGGSNFTNYVCPKCNKTFINDIGSFDEMVMYATEEAKAKVRNILKMDSTSSGDEYESSLVAISNQYAVALRTPSIWNVIIETASLSDKFLEAYADQIDLIAYIDTAYLIDQENMNLIPIDTKPDPNDIAKTAGRRIRVMHDLINKLDSQELYALRSAINELDESANDISYKIPGCKCPDCGSDVPGNDQIGPDGMLFTRHQLAAIASM